MKGESEEGEERSQEQEGGGGGLIESGFWGRKEKMQGEAEEEKKVRRDEQGEGGQEIRDVGEEVQRKRGGGRWVRLKGEE